MVNFVANYAVAVFLFVSILFSSDGKMFDRIRGVDIFVKEVLKEAGNKDLVISDRIIFANVSYEIRERSNNIYMPYKNGEVITNHFQMSSPLIAKRKNDFFLIGGPNDISYLSNKHETNLIKKYNVPFSSQQLKLYEVIFK